MKLSLKNVNGKLRLVVKSVGDVLKFVKDCCCKNPLLDNYVLFNDCCGNSDTPPIAVKVSLVIEFSNQCSNGLSFVVVRIPGQEKCYSASWPPTYPTVSLSVVQAAGLQIFDNNQQIRCVDTQRTSPPNKCNTETCPECPDNCCIAVTYSPRNCPDVQQGGWFDPPVSDPANFFCCSYGRQCTARYLHNFRIEIKRFSYCATGDTCLGNRLQQITLQEQFNDETYKYTRCRADGTRPEFPVECLSHNNYQRYYFQNLNSCTGQTIDIGDQQFFPGCSRDDPLNVGNFPFPPRSLFPYRPRVLQQIDRFCGNDRQINVYEERFQSDSSDSVCENVENETNVVHLVYERDCSIYERTTITTTIRYEVSCNRGSYFFDQRFESRAYGMGCPPDGALTGTTRITRNSSYSIDINATELCDPSLCDQYRRRTAGSPILPQNFFANQTSQGALSLL